MDNPEGKCPRCGDVNSLSRIVCDSCGASLPWAQEVKKYENLAISPATPSIRWSRPTDSKARAIFSWISVVLLGLSLFAFLLLALPTYTFQNAGRREFIEFLWFSGFAIAWLTGILCLFVGIYSKILNYFYGQQRELGWLDAVPFITSWFAALYLLIYVVSSTPYTSPSFYLPSVFLCVIAQIFATSVVMGAVAYRQLHNPLFLAIVLGGFFLSIILFPIPFRAKEHRRVTTIQTNVR